MTVPCMHEIENAAEALMKDLYLGLPCIDTAQVECLHVYIHKYREFIPVNRTLASCCCMETTTVDRGTTTN